MECHRPIFHFHPPYLANITTAFCISHHTTNDYHYYLIPAFFVYRLLVGYPVSLLLFTNSIYSLNKLKRKKPCLDLIMVVEMATGHHGVPNVEMSLNPAEEVKGMRAIMIVVVTPIRGILLLRSKFRLLKTILSSDRNYPT
jgi:hypothetical protein